MWTNKLNILKDENGTSYYSILENKKVPVKSNDIYVVLKSHESLHDLANKYYGDPKMWTVIAMANDLLLPFNIPNNQIIRIPSKNSI